MMRQRSLVAAAVVVSLAVALLWGAVRAVGGDSRVSTVLADLTGVGPLGAPAFVLMLLPTGLAVGFALLVWLRW